MKFEDLTPRQIDALWQKYLRHCTEEPDGHVGWNGPQSSGQILLAAQGAKIEVRQFLWRQRGRLVPRGYGVRPVCGYSPCLKLEHLHLTERTRSNQRLTADSQRRLFDQWKAGVTMAKLASEYGVSRQRISQVIQRHEMIERHGKNGV